MGEAVQDLLAAQAATPRAPPAELPTSPNQQRDLRRSLTLRPAAAAASARAAAAPNAAIAAAAASAAAPPPPLAASAEALLAQLGSADGATATRALSELAGSDLAALGLLEGALAAAAGPATNGQFGQCGRILPARPPPGPRVPGAISPLALSSHAGLVSRGISDTAAAADAVHAAAAPSDPAKAEAGASCGVAISSSPRPRGPSCAALSRARDANRPAEAHTRPMPVAEDAAAEAAEYPRAKELTATGSAASSSCSSLRTLGAGRSASGPPDEMKSTSSSWISTRTSCDEPSTRRTSSDELVAASGYWPESSLGSSPGGPVSPGGDMLAPMASCCCAAAAAPATAAAMSFAELEAFEKPPPQEEEEEEEVAEWYYSQEGEQLGPVTACRLLRLVQEGTLHMGTFVFMGEMEDWLEIRSVMGELIAATRSSSGLGELTSGLGPRMAMTRGRGTSQVGASFSAHL